MAKKDAAWAHFRQVLVEHLKATRTTSKALGEAIGESESAVSDWRQARTTPALAQLPQIAKALRMGATEHQDYDPLFLPQAMGIVPRTNTSQLAQAVDLAYRLEKLQLKITEVQGELEIREGWPEITRAALREGRWAVMSWPITEGTSECRLRVADHIDIIRTDTTNQLPLTAGEVWNDPDMKAALRAAYAVQETRHPQCLASTTGIPVSCWSMGHLGVPMRPAVQVPYERVPTLAFTASTVFSWVDDLAGLVALSIGYGQSTTRDLAMEIFGVRPHALSDEQQLHVHGRLLNTPASRRCWSHHSGLAVGWQNLFDPPAGTAGRPILHVWLDEDDEVLRDWSDSRKGGPELWLKLVKHRDASRNAARGREDVIVLRTAHASSVESRWSQVFDQVVQVLEEGYRRKLWSRHQLLAARRSGLQRRPALTTPLFDLLDTRGV